MSVFFDAREIVQFAIRIEENGEKFYRYALGMAKDEGLKEIFTYLAEEENKHKRTFEDLISKMEKYEPVESYPNEYFEYLKAYVENIIFTPETRTRMRVHDVASAVNFGIQRELDSILYYHEIKKFVPQHQHSLLEKIIDEERRHFSKLLEVKKRYTDVK